MNDDDESAIFEPVVILPSQVWGELPWVTDTSGPIALMLAVLEEAARCIERGRRRRHSGIDKPAAEADAWVRSDSREWLFAFASICDVLGLDVDAARARLLTDGEQLIGGTRVPVRRTVRGRGRVSVCPGRAPLRAA